MKYSAPDLSEVTRYRFIKSGADVTQLQDPEGN